MKLRLEVIGFESKNPMDQIYSGQWEVKLNTGSVEELTEAFDWIAETARPKLADGLISEQIKKAQPLGSKLPE